MGQYLRPALTTMQQPIVEIGGALINILESLLRQEKPIAPQVLIPPCLVVRNSCGAPLR
jgi:DNA-binding LacI/PurR family transcriptional regulator